MRKNIIKNLLFCMGCAMAMLLAACSKTEDIPDNPEHNNNNKPNEPSEEVGIIQLVAKETHVNIFALTQFSILDDNNNSLLFNWQYLAGYDSIVWKISNTEGDLMVFKTEYGDGYSGSNLTSSWSHCFNLPGSYETYLLGYKEKQIVYSDTLQIEVTNKKDFLGRNWEDTDDLGINTSYVNVLNKNFNFCTLAKIDDGIPTIDLRLWNNESEDEAEFCKKSESELYKLMVQLYGQPRFIKGSPELITTYSSFNARPQATTPLAFWATDKSKMILLKKEDPEWNIPECYVHAEPADE